MNHVEREVIEIDRRPGTFNGREIFPVPEVTKASLPLPEKQEPQIRKHAVNVSRLSFLTRTLPAVSPFPHFPDALVSPLLSFTPRAPKTFWLKAVILTSNVITRLSI